MWHPLESAEWTMAEWACKYRLQYKTKYESSQGWKPRQVHVNVWLWQAQIYALYWQWLERPQNNSLSQKKACVIYRILINRTAYLHLCVKTLKINDRMKCGWRERLVAWSHVHVLHTSAVLCIVIQIALQYIIASRLFGL